MEEKYIVYKTTNLINGKFYIGVHKINGSNYLGSGIALKNAIKKYGRDNFIRETLKEFSNEQDAYDYEKQIVNEELIKNDMCYNLVEGGGCPPLQKGVDHYNYGKHWSLDIKLKMSAAKQGINHPCYGKHLSQETRTKISQSQLGKIIPEERKNKIRNSLSSKLYYIDNNVFISSTEAAKFFNVHHRTILRWCTDERKPNCYSISKTS